MRSECNIVRDLLPLYLEDMVSEDTSQFIKDHLEKCPECRRELEAMKSPDEVRDTVEGVTARGGDIKPFKKIMKRMNRHVYSLSYAVVVIFVFLGFSLTGGENLMYNSLIMPAVGVFGYFAFKWKAIYKMPILLFAIDLVAFAFGMVDINLASVLPWTFIYSIFVLIGVAIAFLLHYAFRKE